MKRHLVSIISQHSLPNFLFIKEMAGQYDNLLFITTEEMKDRAEQMETALDLPINSIRRIKVDGNNFQQAYKTLSAQSFPKEDRFIVNMTGGTKMMSLAVWLFFYQEKNSFYYVPINKNQYYNLLTNTWMPLEYRASLREYFLLYGLSFKADNSLTHDGAFTFNQFNNVKMKGFHLPYEMKHSEQAVTPEARRYYGGEWFEEYTYLRIQKECSLDDEHIAKSLKIYRSENQKQNDNEIDVAFMLNNQLYVIECKVTMTGYVTGMGPTASTKETIDKYLYKLAAVSKNYGLQVKPYLFTLHNMARLSADSQDNITKRCAILGIKIIGTTALSAKKILF